MYMVRMDGPDGSIEGIIWRHLVHGNECVNVIPFNMLRKPNWTAEGEWPNITIKPRIRCAADTEGGEIIDGKWVAHA